MAQQGYATGISAQPIDVTSGARAFMKSAVQTRLDEIASSEQRINKNQEQVMKALSVKALPELAREQRDRYQTEIEKYRQQVVDKFRNSKGELSMKDQTAIQDGFVDLQTRMAGEVNDLKMFQKYQEKIYDPNFKYAYDANKYEKVLADAYSNLSAGKGIGNIAANVAQAQITPSVGDYVAKRYDDAISRLDVEALGDFSGNVFTSTEVQDKAEVERLRNSVMEDPNVKQRFTINGQVDPVKQQETQQLVEDYINKKITDVKPYRQTTGSRSSSDRYRNATDYTPSAFDYKGNNYSLVRVPSDVTQTERNFFVDGAMNLDTKEKAQLTQDNAQIVGVDVEKGVILLEGKGGFATKGGKTLYASDKANPTKQGNEWTGAITSNVMNSEWQAEQIQNSYTGDRPIESVKDVTKTETDGIITITGTVVYDKKGWGTGNGEEKISVTYKPFTDPSTSAVFEAPMKENKEAVANMFPKVLVNGKPLEAYFSEQPKKSAKEIERLDKNSGKVAIFDADTKQFIRWK